MKEKIMRLPIIDYLIRLIVGLLWLPKHIDDLKKGNEQLTYLNSHLSELNTEKENKINELKEIEKEKNSRLETVEVNVRNLNFITERLRKLELDDSYFELLNLKMSVHKTLWGSSDRLHISSTAAVFTCFFNTNSGEISIGDYTYAGSNVSILAGSHDKNLTGLLRRDVEITKGCDIDIGNGVWLGSNSIILGPAIIGDNAVIAAGAVVVPGTNVPANTVYGGIPAKQISVLDLEDSNDINSKPIKKALSRNKGVLFVDGWSDKTYEFINGTSYLGHNLLKETAVIYTNKDKLNGLIKKDKEISVKYKINDSRFNELKVDEDGKFEIDISSREVKNKNQAVFIKTKILKDDVDLDKQVKIDVFVTTNI